MLACACALGAFGAAVRAQDRPAEPCQAEAPPTPQPEATEPQPSELPAQPRDAGVAAEAAPDAAQLEAARGEAPLSPEAIIGEGVGVLEGSPAEPVEPVPQAQRGRPSDK